MAGREGGGEQSARKGSLKDTRLGQCNHGQGGKFSSCLLPFSSTAQRHILEEQPAGCKWAFHTKGRKEGKKDALSNTNPEPRPAQRPEGRFPSVLAAEAGAPAVLTVVFTQIPVHGADVQPRRCLTSPWAPATGSEGPASAPPRTPRPIVTRFEYNRGKHLGEAVSMRAATLDPRTTGVLGAPVHKNFYSPGSDGVLLVTCVLIQACEMGTLRVPIFRSRDSNPH